MDIKKLLIGGIIAGALYFGLSYAVYGKLIMSFMQAHPGVATGVDRSMDDLQFLYIAGGNLLAGFLLSYIFVRVQVSSLVSGFITGGVIGFLGVASFDCIMYGTSLVISKTGMAADVAAYTAITAVIGAILGMVMGMGKKAA